MSVRTRARAFMDLDEIAEQIGLGSPRRISARRVRKDLTCTLSGAFGLGQKRWIPPFPLLDQDPVFDCRPRDFEWGTSLRTLYHAFT